MAHNSSTAFILTPFHLRPSNSLPSPSNHSISHSRHAVLTVRPTTRVFMCVPSHQPSESNQFLPIVPSSSKFPSQSLEAPDHSIVTDIAGGAPGSGLTGSGGDSGNDGNNNNNNSNDHNRFDRDEGDGDYTSSDSQQKLSSLLSENKASISDIPKEIMSAFDAKLISISAISNYFVARSNPLSRIMLPIPAMRDRFLADKLFLLKILIEEGIGLCGKLSAEYEQRRVRFWREGEFVMANVIMAMLADFALVYFPAPSLSLVPPSKSSSGFFSWLSSLSSTLPSNIFQTDRPFTLAQRTAGFVFKFSQLFTVGFLCCFSGVVITNGLVFIRERVDPSYKPETKKQNPFIMSVLYATFLGASSGTRYQLVNGVENLIFPRLFAKTPALLEQIATFGLRFGNTFWGSQQWVMFARFTNVQKLQEEPQKSTKSHNFDSIQDTPESS